MSATLAGEPGAAAGRIAVVIPTVGRPSLQVLLDSLADSRGALLHRVVVVDDRPGLPTAPVLTLATVPPRLRDRLVLLRSGGRGPAAARNTGWRRATPDCDWVAFVDDDVVLSADWLTVLSTDLGCAADDVAGVQGRVTVPLPTGRRPTDWERGTAGLATARWITADLAYRRAVLCAVGGFDERFPRAFREDADLALRVMDAGWRLVMGERRVTHPVRPATWRASLNQQRGNADDPLMRRLHGPGWGERAASPPGRRLRHALITTAAVAAAGSAVTRRRTLGGAAAAVWALGTAEFAYARIQPGPRTPAELASMAVTSLLIPPAAVAHWLRGCWRWRKAGPWHSGFSASAEPAAVAAVLFDRDGTLVHDVPYNGDPDRVEPVTGAAESVAAVRVAGLGTAVVSNQSGIARGLLTRAQVQAVNEHVDALLGGFDSWQFCPHGPDDGCRCRKPGPGLIEEACRALDVHPTHTVVIGDIAADVDAARAARARGVLVPTDRTRVEEIAAAEEVAFTLPAAVGLALSAAARPTAAHSSLVAR